MWQICGHIPQTLISETDVTCMAAQLSVSFFIETFIHAKEKVKIKQDIQFGKNIKFIELISNLIANHGALGGAAYQAI